MRLLHIQLVQLGLLLHLLPGALAEAAPQLQYMYLKYDNQPIDTEPMFKPEHVKYKATMDWKMKYFSVQAMPIAPAIIENIHLCREDADCSKEDQSIVVPDFSRSILMMPGGTARFRFNVILHGKVQSFTITITRLQGFEAGLKDLILQGVTLYPVTGKSGLPTPGFQKDVTRYRCLMDVELEVVKVELHLLDAGQVVIAQADTPILLSKNNNFSLLKNSRPGQFEAPHFRLRRRLLVVPAQERNGSSTSEALEELQDTAPRPRRLMHHELVGEFQYPNRYVQFPVPLNSRRVVHLKVVSSDGNHFGYYTLEVARGTCPPASPLFDVVAARCVRFCNTGFFGDFQAGRCKRCQDTCFTCLSSHRCTSCPPPIRELAFELDNVTGACHPRPRSLWEQHPQKTTALILTVASLSVFLCGLCAFRLQQPSPPDYGRPQPREAQMENFGERRAPRIGAPTAPGSVGVGRFLGRGGTATAKYTQISGADDDMG